ncbi:carbamoyl phosphate synthase small subunit [Candidatus Vidania fulgoroideorum]
MKCTLIINKKKFFLDAFGYKKNFFGEIIFNTSNVGYQETLTDPSYYNKILVFTSVNIGNTGINIFDNESHRIWLGAIIVKNLSLFYSHYHSYKGIYYFLKKNKVLILKSKSTRDLVKEIRKKKTNAYIFFKKKKKIKNKIKKPSKNSSTNLCFSYCEKKNYIKKNFYNIFKNKIIVLDFGLKYNILRNIKNNYLIILNYKNINFYKKIKPKGIILTNGPGNPCLYNSIKKKILKITKKIPTLAICLGHQILFFSSNSKISKMKVGHHGINHPIKIKKRIYITSQNHDFVVNKKSKIKSLFDNTNQGFIKKKIFSLQGHPEGCPGPEDLNFIFKKFLKSL